MRENMGVYRGKTKDGEWVEGDLLGNKVIVSAFSLKDEDFELKRYLEVDRYSIVLPETVGEWTGLTDKNGVRAFEHHIISANICDYFISGNKEQIIYGVIKYGEINTEGVDEIHLGFYIEWLDDERNISYDLLRNDIEFWLKNGAVVCESRADNPELVKE